ncbi:MAG: LamG domain-containing protein, partial [Phycisphaerales bacterium]
SAEAAIVGWWKLDDGAGTVAVDSSGNGYDGTITDATWETGQYGGALGFAGSGYVELPAEAWSTIEMQATFTFWAYGDPAAQPQANFIFGAFQDAGNNESRVMSAHVPWSNGQVYFDTGGTTAGGYDRIQKTATAEEYAGSWQHWALVKNGETGDQQIYLNGVLWHSGTGMTRPMTGVTAFTIGAKPQITNFYFGMMDDVRLYDHALTEDEIQTVVAGAGAEYPLAMSPDPKDGAMLEATWGNLAWRAGSFAVSHDLYFGTSFDDVNDGAEGTFVGNLATTFQVVGFAGFPAPEGLQPGTTYYWRVDEVNDANAASPWKGDVWSFWIPPKEAYEPSPADGAGFIDPSAELSWTPGFGATLQYVYFGENFDDVNTATGTFPQTDSTFRPAMVEKEKNYYWRVDEFDGIATHKGDVWSFSTMPEIPITDPNLQLWYSLDEAQGGRAIDWSGHDNHGAIEGTAQWLADGYDGPAFQFGGREYVAVQNSDQIKLISTDSYSVAVHVKLEDLDQQAILFHGLGCSTWASWFLGVAGGEPGVVTTPQSFVFGVREANGGAYTGVSAPARTGSWVHVAATYDGSLLRLYVDGVEMSSGAVPLPWNSGEDLHIGADPGCGGRVFSTAAIDDLRIYDRALTADEILLVMRVDPLLAWGPSPANGSTPDIDNATPLSWSPGESATSHEVYFGTDADAVASAETSDTTGIYRGRQNATSFTPAEGVEWGAGPFYWRIDEDNTDGTVTKGRVWSFAVADFLLVDDFESYDDVDPAPGEPGI